MAPEFYRLNSSGGSLPTHMQGTKSDIPGVYTSALSNGNPSPNLTTPALFPDAGDVVANFERSFFLLELLTHFQMEPQLYVGDSFSGLVGVFLASKIAPSMIF